MKALYLFAFAAVLSCSTESLALTNKEPEKPVEVVEAVRIDGASCRVLPIEGDQVPQKGYEALFDGKWPGGYHRFEDVEYKYFGWDCQSETPWFTFDIGSVERLAKLTIMPYWGFEQKDPAVFQIWAYTGSGEVPSVTPADWKESGSWVKVLDADLSLLFDKTRDLESRPADIGNPEKDPCVEGATLMFGDGKGAYVKARYYRFCVDKCFFGAFAPETKKKWFNRWDCTISELLLWKCANEFPDPKPLPEPAKPVVSERPGDLVLLYCGNVKHTAAEDTEICFEDYLVTDEKKPRWMFDGILFLEIVYNHMYTYMGANQKRAYEPATLAHIEYLWNNWFGTLLPKLDKTVGKMKTKALNAPEKEKIVLMLPIVPFRRECAGWGNIAGLNTSDFYDWSNVLEIYRYLLDRMIGKFEECGFKNLELCGIYWPEEGSGLAPVRTRQLAEIVHSKGLNFNLIPYFNPGFERNMFSCWQDFGFDGFYLQPNYFNNKDATTEKLDGACKIAIKYGFDNEMEMALSRFPDSVNRFEDYMDFFESNGVFETKKLAYYQDMAEITKMKAQKNEDRDIYELYLRLCNYIASRREKRLE